MKRYNKTIIVLVLISGVALVLPQFMYFKKLRIVANEIISALFCLGDAFYIVMGLIFIVLVLVLLDKHWAYCAAELFCCAAFVLLLYYESQSLESLPLEKTEFSRLSFGPGMWLWLASTAGVIIKASERVKLKWWLPLIISISALLIAALAVEGRLDGLAVMKEYYSQKSMYLENLITHITITLGVMAAAIIIGVPLGYLVQKSKAAEKITFSIINITETIPGISFIALLMIPFALLSTKYPELRQFGIKQFGAGPACVALTFYAVFPIVHNTRAGFKLVDGNFVEVAKAMGMSGSTIFFKIMLPLAFPAIINGIRIAAVYTVTGTTLASMIGGGGLGYYMLQTDSMDTVLLGAIPVVIMAFSIDKGLRSAVRLLPFVGEKRSIEGAERGI
ncbi:MAG: hypothetical protein CVU91_05570 [Firmicutes bacterium HGW-Firmicutes-16]|nr:MAG: hypothetical protein CVU91_05570 [Firmicutes bacterium HGW-Firmicutes-16]